MSIILRTYGRPRVVVCHLSSNDRKVVSSSQVLWHLDWCREARWCPIVIVSGRSVLSRSVMQGTPMTVVSSVMPPESVITALLLSTR